MATSILITGASGLIGSKLTELLLQSGNLVSHLGRARRTGGVPSFVWDVENGFLDDRALEGVDTIIHLAGAGVADKRWTAERKREILESRTRSTTLLYEHLHKAKHSVRSVISASAIGYYGASMEDTLLTEESKAGEDYLSNVVTQWEAAADQISTIGIRVVKIRVGIVLSDQGGALKEIARPIRWGAGAILGTGKQFVSWIHIDDLCRIFIKAAEDISMSGAFNGTGPYAVSNYDLTKAIARTLRRPLWLPPLPAFALRLLIGEMAEVVLNGSNVSSAKIQKAGFAFHFQNLEYALNNLLNK